MTSKKSYVAEQQAVNHTPTSSFDELVASAIFSNQQKVDEIRAEFGIKKPTRREREQYRAQGEKIKRHQQQLKCLNDRFYVWPENGWGNTVHLTRLDDFPPKKKLLRKRCIV